MVTYPLLQWDYLVTEVGVHKAASKGPGKQVAARGANTSRLQRILGCVAFLVLYSQEALFANAKRMFNK